MELPALPFVIDPETGLPEKVGNGRVAIMKRGEPVVARLVELPEPLLKDGEPDVLSNIVATGELHNN
jgi:hypothetical protein